ncbi:hypothetical protein J7L01_02520, partial [bacterium]|nr:hypothetical protein [bacterium]
MEISRKFLYICLIFVAATAFAIPRSFNYQGKLTDHDGVAVDSTCAIRFTIYDSPTATAALWMETHPSVEVNHGLFDAVLGEIVPFPDSLNFSVGYWIELRIGDETMSPRQRLVSVPYSIRAAWADSVEGIAYVNFIDSVTFIDSVSYIDSINYIDSISYIDSIGYIDHVGVADSVSNRLIAGDGIFGNDYNGF